MNSEKIRNRAIKLHNLYKDQAAQATQEGQAALLMLNKFLKKHNISNIEDLISEKRKNFDVRYYSDEEDSLIHQLLYCLFGDETDSEGKKLKTTYHYLRGSGMPRKVVIVKLTLAEYLEFVELFDFHRKKLKEEIEKQKSLIYDAYIMAQDLYPNKNKIDEDKDSNNQMKSMEEMDKAMAAYHASKSMTNYDKKFKDSNESIEKQKLIN